MMGARSAGLKGRLRKTCQECLDSPSCKPQDETSFFCFCRGISARFVCVSVLHGVRPPARAQSALQDLKSGSDCTAEGQTALTGSELQPPVSTANEISSWSKWCVSAHTRAHTRTHTRSLCQSSVAPATGKSCQKKPSHSRLGYFEHRMCFWLTLENFSRRPTTHRVSCFSSWAQSFWK